MQNETNRINVSYELSSPVFSTEIASLSILKNLHEKISNLNLSYTIKKSFCISKDITQDEIFAKFSTISECTYCTPQNEMIIIGENFFVSSRLDQRDYFSTIHFLIYVQNPEQQDKICKKIYELISPILVDVTVSADVKWYFTNGGRITFAYITEVFDDIIRNEAYPYIEDIDEFIHNFFKSDETVLILSGEPGTGKTRLIRHICKLIYLSKQQEYERNKKVINVHSSRRPFNIFDSTEISSPIQSKQGKEEPIDIDIDTSIISKISMTDESRPDIIYSMDSKVLDFDPMFISFITENVILLILEDIDFSLRSRKKGNSQMYRLLGTSDGFLRSINKKIIISTNCNENEIDEALLRPGRCYAHLRCRKLTYSESLKFLNSFNVSSSIENRSYTLAELYAIIKNKKVPIIKEKETNIGF